MSLSKKGKQTDEEVTGGQNVVGTEQCLLVEWRGGDRGGDRTVWRREVNKSLASTEMTVPIFGGQFGDEEVAQQQLVGSVNVVSADDSPGCRCVYILLGVRADARSHQVGAVMSRREVELRTAQTMLADWTTGCTGVASGTGPKGPTKRHVSLPPRQRPVDLETRDMTMPYIHG